MNHRRQRQPGVGHPAGDDNLTSFFERLDDRFSPEIDIGGGDAGTDVEEFLARFHIGEFFPGGGQFVQLIRNIIAIDDADFEVELHFLRQLDYFAAQADGIDSSGVGYNPNFFPANQRQALPKLPQEIDGITQVGILLSLALEDRHGNLGQEIHGYIIQIPAG